MSRFALVVLVGLTSGCAAVKAEMPSMQPLAFEAGPPAPAVLQENHFSRDRSAIGEAQLKEILAAPVFLEEHARIGVLPVAVRYEIDDAVPVEAAPSPTYTRPIGQPSDAASRGLAARVHPGGQP